MPRTTYYSKKYTAMMQAVKPEDIAAAQAATASVARPARRRNMRVGPVLILLCLAVALLSVLLIPVLVGGAAPVSVSQPAAPQESAQNVVSYDSPALALEALGIEAAWPGTLPEGYTLSSCTAVDGTMLEMKIIGAKSPVLFRAATGSDDLSGADYDSFTYTTSEAVGDTTFGYAGVSEKKLNLAVWTDGDYSYALVAENGVDIEVMRTLAASVA